MSINLKSLVECLSGGEGGDAEAIRRQLGDEDGPLCRYLARVEECSREALSDQLLDVIGFVPDGLLGLDGPGADEGRLTPAGGEGDEEDLSRRLARVERLLRPSRLALLGSLGPLLMTAGLAGLMLTQPAVSTSPVQEHSTAEVGAPPWSAKPGPAIDLQSGPLAPPEVGLGGTIPPPPPAQADPMPPEGGNAQQPGAIRVSDEAHPDPGQADAPDRVRFSLPAPSIPIAYWFTPRSLIGSSCRCNRQCRPGQGSGVQESPAEDTPTSPVAAPNDPQVALSRADPQASGTVATPAAGTNSSDQASSAEIRSALARLTESVEGLAAVVRAAPEAAESDDDVAKALGALVSRFTVFETAQGEALDKLTKAAEDLAAIARVAPDAGEASEDDSPNWAQEIQEIGEVVAGHDHRFATLEATLGVDSHGRRVAPADEGTPDISVLGSLERIESNWLTPLREIIVEGHQLPPGRIGGNSLLGRLTRAEQGLDALGTILAGDRFHQPGAVEFYRAMTHRAGFIGLFMGDVPDATAGGLAWSNPGVEVLELPATLRGRGVLGLLVELLRDRRERPAAPTSGLITGALIAVLHERAMPTEFRIRAAGALGECGVEAAPALIAVWKNPQDEVGNAALNALRRINMNGALRHAEFIWNRLDQQDRENLSQEPW